MSEKMRSSSFERAMDEAEILVEDVNLDVEDEVRLVESPESLLAKFFDNLDRPEKLADYHADEEIVASFLPISEKDGFSDIIERVNGWADKLGVSAISLLDAILELAVAMDDKKDEYADGF